MGQPKGLLPARPGEPAAVPCLLRAHIDGFVSAGLRVTVVLGAAADRHRAVVPPGVRVVVNEAWATTSLSDSADLALVGLGAVLLTPVDVPPARRATLASLLAAPGSAVAGHHGAPGHPVRLDPPHLRGVRLDVRLMGATLLEVGDPDCLRNLNRPEEYLAWIGATRSGIQGG